MNRLFSIILSLTYICSSATAHDALPDLQLPAVPATITSIPERADYVMTHFWDNLDLDGQPDRINSDNWLEQWTVNYLSLLPHATDHGRAGGFRAMLNAFSSDHSALLKVNSLISKYLDEPESGMFSEQYYITYLTELLNAGVLDNYEKVRPEYQLSALKKNRPGSIATDFMFIDRKGNAKSLHTTDADNLLLIIYDPECDHCAEVMRDIASDTTLDDAVNNGTLTILAIFADGDETAWTKASENLPSQWLGGLDTSGIQENELYTIRELPSLYLLDSQKTIFLKEPTVTDIHKTLTTR